MPKKNIMKNEMMNKQNLNLNMGQIPATNNSNHTSVMIEYFNNNAYDLLHSVIIYLNRELKIPAYSILMETNSEEFSKEAMDAETQQIFKDREDLLPKLQKLQQNIIKKMYDIVDNEKS